MLLASLLAWMDDAVETTARRAALHEVRQRLGLAGRAPKVPSATEQILVELRHYVDHYDTTSVTEFMNDIQALLYAVYPFNDVEDAQVAGVSVLEVPECSGWLDEDEAQWVSLYMVAGDIQEVQAAPRAFRLLRRSRPQDADLAWLFREWRAHHYDPIFPDVMSRKFVSLRDWVVSTGQSLARLTVREALAGSDAWHAQFVTGSFGSPLPDALVVLRWADGWTLQRLMEKRDFAREGTSMGHCVGGFHHPGEVADGDSVYWHRTRDDAGAVFSLRTSAGVPTATVETVNWVGGNRAVVQQIQGPLDGPVDPAARIRLQDAARILEIRDREWSGQAAGRLAGTVVRSPSQIAAMRRSEGLHRVEQAVQDTLHSAAGDLRAHPSLNSGERLRWAVTDWVGGLPGDVVNVRVREVPESEFELGLPEDLSGRGWAGQMLILTFSGSIHVGKAIWIPFVPGAFVGPIVVRSFRNQVTTNEVIDPALSFGAALIDAWLRAAEVVVEEAPEAPTVYPDVPEPMRTTLLALPVAATALATRTTLLRLLVPPPG